MLRAPCALSKPSMTATAPTKNQHVSMAREHWQREDQYIYKRRNKTELSAAPQICRNCRHKVGRCGPSLVASRLALSPLTIRRRAALRCAITSHRPARRAISHCLAPCAVPLAQPGALHCPAARSSAPCAVKPLATG
eukprot:2782267-Pleurochrysis_carterae.AAC.1